MLLLSIKTGFFKNIIYNTMPSRWDWECGFILIDIKTVKTVWPERFMISFYPWSKPWAMGNQDDTS
jgi:hypothetical protein